MRGTQTVTPTSTSTKVGVAVAIVMMAAALATVGPKMVSSFAAGVTTSGTTATSTSAFGCTDTDGGKVFDVKGTVKVGSFSITDSCKNTTTLNEAWCDPVRKYANSVQYTCANGCYQGACNAPYVITCNTKIDDQFVAKYGRNLVLKSDIKNCEPSQENVLGAIQINASNVTLDCQGRSITAASSTRGARYGIVTYPKTGPDGGTIPLTGVTITGCIIKGFSGGGIHAMWTSGQITGNIVENSGEGVLLRDSYGLKVSLNRFTNSAYYGIRVVNPYNNDPRAVGTTTISDNYSCFSARSDFFTESPASYNKVVGSNNICDKVDIWADQGVVGKGCKFKCTR